MPYPCTKEGYQKLKSELKLLVTKERPKVIEEIAVARSYGDLKENAEYHAAKEKQGMIEARIAVLNESLSNLQVVDISNVESDKIQFGAIVEYENLDTGEVFCWQLVGKDEADIENNKISILSPIGRSLIGKEEGDEVEVETPKGKQNLNILSVKYK